MTPKAIVLLSGGLDSATCLGYCKTRGFDIYALSFAYGQRHLSELNAARRLAQQFEVKAHKTITLDYLSDLKGSSLTDHEQCIPSSTSSTGIPSTYVPARNTLFLTHALAWAEILACQHIVIGCSQVDYSGYPDCREPFINAFNQLAQCATKAAVEGCAPTILAPLLYKSKAETILMGHQMGVDYSLTVSCYQADPKGRACGQCDSCTLRQKGFKEAGVPDPTVYLAETE